MDAVAGGSSAFRDVPYMGVIYVVAEAMKLGFTNGDPDWCNLGQGPPEANVRLGLERLASLLRRGHTAVFRRHVAGAIRDQS